MIKNNDLAPTASEPTLSECQPERNERAVAYRAAALENLRTAILYAQAAERLLENAPENFQLFQSPGSLLSHGMRR